MNRQKFFFLTILISIVPVSYGMEQQSTIDNLEENIQELSLENKRREIFFKTIVAFKVGLQSKFAENIGKQEHPLLSSGSPYTQGNGGLLNPILKNCDIKKEPIKNETQTGVRIEIKGYVGADGIAEYKFDKTHMGEHYSRTVEYKGQMCKKAAYEISKLEEAILGVLKERAVDRQMSDLTKGCFDSLGKHPFKDRFIACIKHEWTSKQNNDQDDGIRTPQETELIQRHMMRSTYWPSKWHSPENMRTGEYIRKTFLDGDNDKFSSVELEEFEVSVKIPGTDGKECCIQ